MSRLDEDCPRGPFRAVVFDFDGTLSLLRANWQGLMVPMMVDILASTGTNESRESLVAIVEEFVTRLTGQPTLLQMRALVAEIERRGKTPRPEREYLAEYLEKLLAQTAQRIDAIRSGRATADDMMVPGARQLVEALHGAGLLLVIASGTELAHVRQETTILGLDSYFGPRIFGPVDNDPTFSKQQVLEQLMADHDLRGEEIIAIGDGTTEILAARAVKALAVGVASDEIDRSGQIHPLKEKHLIRAGAHIIVPDYRDLAAILERCAIPMADHP